MKHETAPDSAGSADRMGIRVARAAGKRQAKKQGGKRRSAAKSRAAKSRVKRGTAKPRAARSQSASRGKRAAKPARKATARKPAARKPAGRKHAARKPAIRKSVPPVPPAFATQRAGATSREQLLFEIQRARASVKAAIQGLTAAHAMRPVAPGKWSIFEIVLHLSERDRVRLEEFGRTLAGQPRSWAGIVDPQMAAVNEAHLAPLRAHTWEEAVRRLDSLREELLLRVAEVPARPDDVWQRAHAFGDMMWGLPEHDRHHADQIKWARMESAPPAEDRDV